MTKKCRACGTPLQPSGVGRPPRYCSVGCRRSVEYELTRLGRRAERLQAQLDRMAIDDAVWRHDAYRERLAAEQALVTERLADTERRIRHLLDSETPS